MRSDGAATTFGLPNLAIRDAVGLTSKASDGQGGGTGSGQRVQRVGLQNPPPEKSHAPPPLAYTIYTKKVKLIYNLKPREYFDANKVVLDGTSKGEWERER